MSTAPEPARFSARTAWARNEQTPLREFLRTETGGAAFLLTAAVVALVWVNVDASSYNSVWSTTLSIRVSDASVALDLRNWVNSGLMTFFFFVVGLEARREFDLGEFRERRRFALPLLAGTGGMVAAVATYLAFNAGHPSAHGWGVAMSTDTAFALGMLALVGPRFPDRLRAFMLTVSVVDDIVALIVIATVYSGSLRYVPLAVALVLYAVVVVLHRFSLRAGFVYFAFGAAAWVALLKAGVEPVVIGLAMGALAYAYPASRSTLERATERFREFREQPTAELARSAGAQLRAATSANERLQQLFHPWTSYAIVPLFALANAGVRIGGASSSGVTMPVLGGVVVGLVIGKPLGITVASWLAVRSRIAALPDGVSWRLLRGVSCLGGIGFTMSLFVGALAFADAALLDSAKLGVLLASCVAAFMGWFMLRSAATTR